MTNFLASFAFGNEMKHVNDIVSGLNATKLRELVIYDPETGIFTWRVSVSGRGGWKRQAGQKAGWRDKTTSYLRIQLPGYAKGFLAHRLAWLYMTGEWPEDLLDHKDWDKTNNRWSNIRSANNGENQANRELRSHNTSGFTGISVLNDGWLAECHLNGRSWRQFFKDKGEAVAARQLAVKRLHAEYGVEQ
jgi:hypothetical protein